MTNYKKVVGLSGILRNLTVPASGSLGQPCSARLMLYPAGSHMDAARRVLGIQMGVNHDKWTKGVIILSPYMLGFLGKAQPGTYVLLSG